MGDYLIVSFDSAEVLWHHQRRKLSLPDDHQRALLQGLRMIDEVIITEGHDEGLDFKEDFLKIRPHFLIVTEDDKYRDTKRELCQQVGAQYTVLPKNPPRFEPVSTSSIVRCVQAPTEAPLRVDFAGGWLDVPRFSKPGEFIVKCAISPLVSLREWPDERQAGLGGSGAWALLNGRNGVDSEVDLGVGWQDPAVIHETGVCVWRSGLTPTLDFKQNGDFLSERMPINWTDTSHDTPGIVNNSRDYDKIARSGRLAREGVLQTDLNLLGQGISLYHDTQLEEGMQPLPEIAGAITRKDCGGGHGGYALYVFKTNPTREPAIAAIPELTAIEPVCRL